jgi:hypothetical protein
MLSFFHCPTTRESFRNFRSLQLFSPLPNECQLFVPKDFLGPPCLTLPGEPLVLRERGWKEGGTQITSPLPQFYCSLSPRIHKHWISHFTVPALLKIFVRSRRDQEKKCRIGIRQVIYINFKLKNSPTENWFTLIYFSRFTGLYIFRSWKNEKLCETFNVKMIKTYIMF